MAVRSRLLIRHGKPHTCPPLRELAVEVGDDLPSDDFLQEVLDAVPSGVQYAENGEACYITIELYAP